MARAFDNESQFTTVREPRFTVPLQLAIERRLIDSRCPEVRASAKGMAIAADVSCQRIRKAVVEQCSRQCRLDCVSSVHIPSPIIGAFSFSRRIRSSSDK
jgi:hypothetical protein